MTQILHRFRDLVLIPTFGEHWVEVSAWLALLIFAVILGILISICLHYAKRYKELVGVRKEAIILDTKNQQLKQEKIDLEESLKFVKKELDKEKETNQALLADIDALEKSKAELRNQLEEYAAEKQEAKEKQKRKRAQAAKKAAQTRKKNKEILETLIESLPVDTAIKTKKAAKRKAEEMKTGEASL